MNVHLESRSIITIFRQRGRLFVFLSFDRFQLNKSKYSLWISNSVVILFFGHFRLNYFHNLLILNILMRIFSLLVFFFIFIFLSNISISNCVLHVQLVWIKKNNRTIRSNENNVFFSVSFFFPSDFMHRQKQISMKHAQRCATTKRRANKRNQQNKKKIPSIT